MATTLPPQAETGPMDWTIADVQKRLDGIPADRIRTFPAPGTATVEDVLRVRTRTGRAFELVDGILVEKAMGSLESRLASVLIHLLETFLEVHDLGVVLGEAGVLRLFPELVRAPDVSFLRWERFPEGEFPKEAVWRLAPDLAVEILSEGNAEAEMERKVREYFKAGSRRVWVIDPPSRAAKVYTSPRRFTVVDKGGLLDAGDLLPGFEISLKDWFARAQRRAPRRRKS